ncbi:MAG: PAS domain-containing protein [Tistlia sp.]|uniref:PAS domain-containing protein n=1 Tax=Tistlia sp. TaxID=3057121 RepID=UPI0034A586F7
MNEFSLPPQAIDDMQWVLAHWRAQKGAQALPSKSLIDVTDFPARLLPMLFLLERIEAEASYVVRLAGTSYRLIYGREITGLTVDELLAHSDAGTNLRADLSRALESAEPVFIDGLMTWPASGAKVPYQRLLLPYCAEPEGPVRFLLGVARMTDPRIALRT